MFSPSVLAAVVRTSSYRGQSRARTPPNVTPLILPVTRFQYQAARHARYPKLCALVLLLIPSILTQHHWLAHLWSFAQDRIDVQESIVAFVVCEPFRFTPLINAAPSISDMSASLNAVIRFLIVQYALYLRFGPPSELLNVGLCIGPTISDRSNIQVYIIRLLSTAPV